MGADASVLSKGDLSGRNILGEDNMIFITLGSQKFQFNRLLKAVDKLVENGIITDKVFAQIGYSDYKPQHYEFKQFFDREEFHRIMQQSEIVITHGGTGAIIGAVKMGKKVIAVPRLSKYGEHVDDHQLQLIAQFCELDLIYSCEDCEQLQEALRNIKGMKFKDYQSRTSVIIESITKFIEQ